MPSLKLLESVDDDKESSKRKKRKEAHSNEDKRSNANDVNQKRKAKRTKSSSSTTSGEKKNNTKMDSSKGRNNYTHTKANLDPEAKKSSSTTTSDGKKTKSLKMDEGRPPEYPPGGISYSEPIYLCPGGPDEYNVARNIISLSVGLDNPVSKVELGRSKTTGIIWSALSRKLCDVLLVFSSDSCPTTSLIMKKPEQEVAVYINGHELNVGVGEKTVLKHGTILSLYGPTGFAYRVEISSDAENEVPLKRTR